MNRTTQISEECEPFALHNCAIHSGLDLLSDREVQDLRQSLASRVVPRDLQSKLHLLSIGDARMRFISEYSNLFLELFRSGCQGDFTQLTASDLEHVLRVLAYVRKEDDAIPDYLASGFFDDRREIGLAVTQLAPSLRKFESYRSMHGQPFKSWTWELNGPQHQHAYA
jgi:hypothetical protein